MGQPPWKTAWWLLRRDPLPGDPRALRTGVTHTPAPEWTAQRFTRAPKQKPPKCLPGDDG